MLSENYQLPDPGPVKPRLCDSLIKGLAAGDTVAFNGRKIAEDKGVLKQFGIPIVDLLEHTQTVRKKDYIPSETLQKLKNFGEKANQHAKKVGCIAVNMIAKKDPKLEGLIEDLTHRIAVTKMFEDMEYTKRTGHLPRIEEDPGF